MEFIRRKTMNSLAINGLVSSINYPSIETFSEIVINCPTLTSTTKIGTTPCIWWVSHEVLIASLCISLSFFMLSMNSSSNVDDVVFKNIISDSPPIPIGIDMIGVRSMFYL